MAFPETGFRRRIRINPVNSAIQAELEDDFHCMSVVIQHDGEIATEVFADLRRAPWSTCPGAEQKLVDTFKGVLLEDFPKRASKKSNCTHLYDLAMWAYAHINDLHQTVYDVFVSDPIDGLRRAEIKRNGKRILRWDERDFRLVKPEVAEGIRLDQLRDWISTLDEGLQEAAKILQWGNILANGRLIPIQDQSDASKMPASCFTFQPENACKANRVGVIKDFTKLSEEPLSGYPVLPLQE